MLIKQPIAGFLWTLIVFHVRPAVCQDISAGVLYPQDSESREVKCLDGIWNFRLAPRLQPDLGFEEQWFDSPLEKKGEVDLMPVPSSYNDVTQKKEYRDHVGWAWYDRNFRIPRQWQTGRRIFLRFGAVNYHAIVYVNGERVVEHSGGALPFVAELDPTKLRFGPENRVTVAVNNTLSLETVPQGTITWQNGARYPEGYFTQNYNFDFFNYAGIHRPVFLFSTPRSFISDVDVVTRVDGDIGYISYSVKSVAETSNPSALSVSVEIRDKNGISVGIARGEDGEISIASPKLWWPFTMVKDDGDAGYLYRMEISLSDSTKDEADVYRLNVGIRTVNWNEKQFLINGKPFYFRGYGRHEDADLRGKGFDAVLTVKDHNLIKWTGANSYRTSHYPYAEEIMDVADKLGIVIIDEAPAATLDAYNSKLLTNHKQQMKELIQRDKNRPSVVMWSIANEPNSKAEEANSYFKEVIDYTRELDSLHKRPVTLVYNIQATQDEDKAASYLDIISINRYFSWYTDVGHLEVIKDQTILDVQAWADTYKRPIFFSEYGTDTIAGLHQSPEFVFTEEYQTSMMKEYFKAFDYLRNNTSLVGEHIWNFADFMTAQGITRILGNKKGILTRERQPKASAHLLRYRFHLLAQESDDYPVPQDIQENFPLYLETSGERDVGGTRLL